VRGKDAGGEDTVMGGTDIKSSPSGRSKKDKGKEREREKEKRNRRSEGLVS
jgi:hypothetical protein